MPYTDTFQRRMIARLSGPNAVSACALARETGVPQSTLSRWLRAAGTVKGMTDPHANDRSSSDPTSLSAADKQRLLAEADGLRDQELGEFLRRNGLHASDLEAWRAAIESALDDQGSKPRSDRGRREDANRIRELEKELKRKEKALAEAAALLVLQKKVRAIWGDEDDDTPRGSGT